MDERDNKMISLICFYILFSLILFLSFCCRTGKLRKQGYIFAFFVCLLFPISFFLIMLLSADQWGSILNKLGFKINNNKNQNKN